MNGVDDPSRARDLAAECVPGRRSLWRRLPVYFHTVRHLRPGQIASQLKRRALPPRPPAAGPAVIFREVSAGAEFLRAPEPAPAPGKISFVGQLRLFELGAPDWVAADSPKLWRYNLHYFDYLGWTCFDAAAKAALIDDWIARVPVGATDAWEAYPTSLRIVNWLKYLQRLPDASLRKTWLASLAHQAAALEGGLEYHLLANHLLKNGKALVFAGACCDGEAAHRWLQRGLDIVVAEADEQVLADGGHFERSPMYHCIVLEDYLDMVNLLERSAQRVSPQALAKLRQTAERATGFLRTILTGAGDIPLFNDAAFGITVPAGELLAYAQRVLDGGSEHARIAAAVRIDLPLTGYFGYRRGGDSLIVDCGPVGPDYQPGHAHCDMLSYELHLAGIPIVVDSGTFDYEPGTLRHYLRSTAAHSTVRIDEHEQSQIWGQFRVARRARPVDAGMSASADGPLVFSGEHDGYRRLPGAPRHRREIRIDPGTSRGRWTVRDTVTSAGSHKLESFIHLHPEVRCEQLQEREVRLMAPGGVAIRVVFGAVGTLRLASGYYCPRFGECSPRTVLVLEYTGALPVDLTYEFERL